MFELASVPYNRKVFTHPWTETWLETHKGCIVQASAIGRGSVKPKWRMIVLQEAAMRQEKTSSFLQCDNGDQQLYLWCWKKAKFICSLSRGQYWAVHRAGRQAWKVSENHSAHLEAGVRLCLPSTPNLKPCSVSTNPLFCLPASAAATGSNKHFPCMVFPLPPRSKHDSSFPSLPLPGTEWTLGICKGVSGREPLLSPSRVTAHVQKYAFLWPPDLALLKPWESPKGTCTPTLPAIVVLFECEIWELRKRAQFSSQFQMLLSLVQSGGMSWVIVIYSCTCYY